MPPYNAYELNEQLVTTMHRLYPQFRSLSIIVTGEPGTGKSTVAASCPVPAGTIRMALDGEDSMEFLDAGPDGNEFFSPNRHTFRMTRLAFPDIGKLGQVYRAILHPTAQQKNRYGALLIDNIAVFQDQITAWLVGNAGQPEQIRALYKEMEAPPKTLPVDSQIRQWASFQDPGFWSAPKALVTRLFLACRQAGIHFIGTTETKNVWENYNKPGAKIVGQKAKVWDVWYRYTQMILILTRDVNTHNPPTATLSPYQPKMRFQNMRPKFTMDWPSFIAEIAASAERTEQEVPPEFQVRSSDLIEEDEITQTQAAIHLGGEVVRDEEEPRE